MIKTSTGLRNAMLTTGSFKSTMDLCRMRIYAGAAPATADAALSGASLLCTVTNDASATGLTFEAVAVSGVATKTLSEIWRGVNDASGTATFYRLESASDDGSLSETFPRVQGSVGVAGADLNLSSAALTSGASQSVDYYSMALPTA